MEFKAGERVKLKTVEEFGKTVPSLREHGGTTVKVIKVNKKEGIAKIFMHEIDEYIHLSVSKLKREFHLPEELFEI